MSCRYQVEPGSSTGAAARIVTLASPASADYVAVTFPSLERSDPRHGWQGELAASSAKADVSSLQTKLSPWRERVNGP